MAECVIFEPEQLLPEAWRAFASPGPVRMFNPGLLRDGDGWIFAYRVVGPDLARRIGLCRLAADFRVVAGSQAPTSDLIRFVPENAYSDRARAWFADPRLYRLGDRLFMSWNSGWHDPMNHQFMQELDGRLHPVGVAREMVLQGAARQPLEKNWTFFGDGPFYCVYGMQPHRILGFSLAEEGTGKRGDVVFSDVASTEWSLGDYSARFGPLRGGAPPQRIGDEWFSVCHSHYQGPAGLCYAAAAYRFSALHPFAPIAGPLRPLGLPNPHGSRNVHERLNPVVGEVIYPCGAVHQDGQWTISYGINDEFCAIAVLPHSEILASMAP